MSNMEPENGGPLEVWRFRTWKRTSFPGSMLNFGGVLPFYIAQFYKAAVPRFALHLLWQGHGLCSTLAIDEETHLFFSRGCRSNKYLVKLLRYLVKLLRYLVKLLRYLVKLLRYLVKLLKPIFPGVCQNLPCHPKMSGEISIVKLLIEILSSFHWWEEFNPAN